MKFKISKSERKQYFGTNCMFAIFFQFTSHLVLRKAHFLLLIAHFLLLIAHFLGNNASLLVLKDFRPSRA